jgi:hypothetical protein
MTERDPQYDRDGREMARAVAKEAVLRCADPVYGQMVTEVIFKDEARSNMLLEEYMVAIESLVGITRKDRERYFRAENGYWGNQDRWEQGFFDQIDMEGALIDLTEGPY